jgi:hypothetical protein
MLPASEQQARTRRAPNLAVLASLAAIALDRKSRGQEESLASVNELAKQLRNCLAAGTAPGAGRVAQAFVSLNAVDVLGRALLMATAVPATSLDDITSRATVMLDGLENAATEDDLTKIRALMDFCVALSRSFQAQWGSLFPTVPEHPYVR